MPYRCLNGDELPGIDRDAVETVFGVFLTRSGLASEYLGGDQREQMQDALARAILDYEAFKGKGE